MDINYSYILVLVTVKDISSMDCCREQHIPGPSFMERTLLLLQQWRFATFRLDLGGLAQTNVQYHQIRMLAQLTDISITGRTGILIGPQAVLPGTQIESNPYGWSQPPYKLFRTVWMQELRLLVFILPHFLAHTFLSLNLQVASYKTLAQHWSWLVVLQLTRALHTMLNRPGSWSNRLGINLDPADHLKYRPEPLNHSIGMEKHQNAIFSSL